MGAAVRTVLRHAPSTGAGPIEVTRFLSSLAVDRRVSASTQNQALGALVFLYRDVLDAPVGWLAALVRAKRLSGDESVRRSTHRPAPPPSFTRNGRAACLSRRRARCGDHQGGKLSHAPALIRYALPMSSVAAAWACAAQRTRCDKQSRLISITRGRMRGSAC